MTPRVRDARSLAATLLAGVALAGITPAARAQSLAGRVTASDGTVWVIYPSRPDACGDGEDFIGHLLGNSTFYSGASSYSGNGRWMGRPCLTGPVRVAASVFDHEVTRVRAYVGPVPENHGDARVLTVSASDAVAWLSGLVTKASNRVASDAMLPLIAADAPDPWPLLLRTARADDRPRGVRSAAMMWLGAAVNEHLGIADARDDTPDDEMRSQAVFVMSQRPKSESVPVLIDAARSSPHPATRRAAIFWLGQTGDPRAVDVYAELLGLR